jgi:hypothetical protein
VCHSTFFRIPLSDDQMCAGDVHLQVLYLDPAANPLQLGSINGIRVNVR